MKQYQTLEFMNGRLRFSAGHFTVFSKTHRERLHGHNYTLHASMTAAIAEPGITFDYDLFRNKLVSLCEQLHARFLLATESPYVTIDADDEHYHITFDGKRMSLLKDDVLLMPLCNISLEELSRWFIEQLSQDAAFIREHDIIDMTVKVFNGPEHCASSQWVKTVKESQCYIPRQSMQP